MATVISFRDNSGPKGYIDPHPNPSEMVPMKKQESGSTDLFNLYKLFETPEQGFQFATLAAYMGITTVEGFTQYSRSQIKAACQERQLSGEMVASLETVLGLHYHLSLKPESSESVQTAGQPSEPKLLEVKIIDENTIEFNGKVIERKHRKSISLDKMIGIYTDHTSGKTAEQIASDRGVYIATVRKYLALAEAGEFKGTKASIPQTQQSYVSTPAEYPRASGSSPIKETPQIPYTHRPVEWIASIKEYLRK